MMDGGMMAIFDRVRGTGGGLRGRVIGTLAALVGCNALAWLWAVTAFRDYPVLLGTALLAYGFGLRHAFDADHIAAIDNVTRKLMRQGRRPVGVGLFFSLGHSTVVIGLSAAIAIATAALQARFEMFKAVGGMIGTGVSAFFLLAIAIANLVVLRGIYRAFRRVKAGEGLAAQDLDVMLAGRGLLARLFRGLFRLVGRSWHMYPLGVLFGLGFDTATEVGLLGISAASAAKGLSIWSILVFPALFTAGMTLADTIDGMVMLGAYGWAFTKPIRKLYYNMTITGISVLVALLIGGLEALGLLADALDLQGGLWGVVGDLTDQFGALGYLIVGIFIGSWLVSALVYRLRGYDQIDAEAGETAT